MAANECDFEGCHQRWLANVMSQSRGVCRSHVCDVCIHEYLSLNAQNIPEISFSDHFPIEEAKIPY